MEVLVYLGCALLSLHFALHGIMESGIFSFLHRGATVTTSSATQSQRFRFHKKQSQSQNVPLDKVLSILLRICSESLSTTVVRE